MLMNCREFSIKYSAQLDGHADDQEKSDLQQHLRQCLSCRRNAAGMRRLISDVRNLGDNGLSEDSRGMTRQIQSAVHREARLQASYSRRRANFMDLWRTRLFSQGVGAIVSMAMFLMMAVGVLRPAYRALALAQAATQLILEESGTEEIRLKLMLLAPPPPPIFNPNGELLGIGASMSEDEEIMATVKVARNGRALVNRIVGPSTDPAIVSKLSNIINQSTSFHRVRRDQNASAEAVVIFSKVNISADLN